MIPVFISRDLENSLKKAYPKLLERLYKDIDTRLSINPTRTGNNQRIRYVGRNILPLFELKYDDFSARIYYFVENDRVLIVDYYIDGEVVDFVNIVYFSTKNKQGRILDVIHRSPKRTVTTKTHKKIR